MNTMSGFILKIPSITGWVLELNRGVKAGRELTQKLKKNDFAVGYIKNRRHWAMPPVKKNQPPEIASTFRKSRPFFKKYWRLSKKRGSIFKMTQKSQNNEFSTGPVAQTLHPRPNKVYTRGKDFYGAFRKSLLRFSKLACFRLRHWKVAKKSQKKRLFQLWTLFDPGRVTNKIVNIIWNYPSILIFFQGKEKSFENIDGKVPFGALKIFHFSKIVKNRSLGDPVRHALHADPSTVYITEKYFHRAFRKYIFQIPKMACFLPRRWNRPKNRPKLTFFSCM